MSEELTPEVEESKDTYTKEEMTAAVKARVDRLNKKYSDYDELKAKAQRLDEIELESKTELEKAVLRAEKAEAEALQLQTEKDRRTWAKEISESTGVPVDIIRGSSREEMEEHAASLSRYFKTEHAPTVTSEGFAPHSGKKMTTASQFAHAIEGIF